MKCTQPGCSGTIVDGYCDVCGMAASSPAATGSASPGSASSSSASPSAAGVPAMAEAASTPTSVHPATRLTTGPSIPEGGACLQPGCNGTIDAGYCNVCGTPADQQAPAALASNGPAGDPGDAPGAGPDLSTRSSASSNLATAA